MHAGLFTNNRDQKLYCCLLGCCCQIYRSQMNFLSCAQSLRGRVCSDHNCLAFGVSHKPVKKKKFLKIQRLYTKLRDGFAQRMRSDLLPRIREFSPKAPLLHRFAQPGRTLIHPRDPEKGDPNGASPSLKKRPINHKAILLACFSDWM